MINIYDTLVEIEAKLSGIGSIKTLSIGMERGINAKDCPFVRVVPEMNTSSEQDYCINNGGDDLTFEVIFGFDRKNRDIKKLYSDYYTLESEIRSALLNTTYTKGRCVFLHTVTDEDKLDNIKSALSRFKIVGIEW